jgi:hypothetical protein
MNGRRQRKGRSAERVRTASERKNVAKREFRDDVAVIHDR